MKITKQNKQEALIIFDSKINITNSQEIKKKLMDLIEEGYIDLTMDFLT